MTDKRLQRARAAMRPGHTINNRGELVPIPGAITGYDANGKPVIAVPLKKYEAILLRKLRVVSIESLVEADGDVPSAESEPALQELRVPTFEVTHVAGEDIEEDPETQEPSDEDADEN